MSNVYLAGKMGNRMGYEVLQERAHAREVCEGHDLEVSDPAATEFIPSDRLVDTKLDYLTMQSYVSKDEFAIRQCHVLLVLTGDTPSEGTGLEFGLALQRGIPIVLVSPKRVKGELMGFWSIKASAIFSTVEEAAEYIAENFQ